jgi:AAA domain
VCVEQGANAMANKRAVDAVAALTDKEQQRSEMPLMVVRSLGDAAGAVTSADGPTEQAVSSAAAGADRKWEDVARAAPPGLDKGRVIAAVREMGMLRPPLNSSQKNAVKQALLRSMSIIQGPPGTGKTVTAACVAVGAVLAGCGPVLATAASNVAVDNLLEKVLVAGRGWRRLRVVRVGRVAAVDESLWEYTLEGMLENDPVVLRAREEAEKNPAAATASWEVEQAAASRIVRGADIVLTTCIGAGREALADLPFKFLLVDEASQATEPDVLVPLTVGSSETLSQLVLVGDHHQLPPTVLSDGAAPNGLSRSLFSRMWSSGVMSTMLDTQYRMHPDISYFPSKQFYFGKLATAVAKSDRPLPLASNGAGITDRVDTVGIDRATLQGLLQLRRVLFVNVPDGRDERDTHLRETGNAFSFVNRNEARAACDLARQLPFGAEEIGLISPYSGQVRLLSRIMATNEEKPVEISTVDGFQGREKAAIVFSTVRSNNDGRVGFLADWRRLNVALTRAKSVLVVVGNFTTLRRDKHWTAWLRHAPITELGSLCQVRAGKVADG